MLTPLKKRAAHALFLALIAIFPAWYVGALLAFTKWGGVHSLRISVCLVVAAGFGWFCLETLNERLTARVPLVQYSLRDFLIALALLTPWILLNSAARPLAVYEPWIAKDSAWEFGFPIPFCHVSDYGTRQSVWWPALLINGTLPALQLLTSLLLFNDLRTQKEET